jgi:D-psicose/D-tagatose/L-ribulose 3-epimerase
MNKIGIYYAYWEKNWDADFVPYVAKVKKLGFDVLEVNSGTVTRMPDKERLRLKTAAEKAGIELTYCIGMPPEFDIASPDAAIRKAGVKFLQDQARMVEFMGSEKLGGIIYGSWPGRLPANANKEECTRRSVKSMQEVMKVVEDCGVYFNVEVVNRFEQYMLNTCEEAIEYVDRVGSQRCKILLDTFHMNIEEDNMARAIIKAGARLGHLHVGEGNRRAPGRGHLPWQEIAAALKKIRYKGAVVMEPFLRQGGEVGRDIAVYRDLQGTLDLDAEARRACRFLRTRLAK